MTQDRSGCRSRHRGQAELLSDASDVMEVAWEETSLFRLFGLTFPVESGSWDDRGLAAFSARAREYRNSFNSSKDGNSRLAFREDSQSNRVDESSFSTKM